MLMAAECKIFKEGKRILTEYPGGFKCQGDKFVCGAKLTVQSTFLCSCLVSNCACFDGAEVPVGWSEGVPHVASHTKDRP